MKYSMLTSISKALSLALLMCSMASAMQRGLIIRGQVKHTEKVENNTLKITFEADCLYNGILGKVAIVKTINDRDSHFLCGEITTGTQENLMITKLHHSYAGTPFDILSAGYILQNRNH